MVSRVQSRPVVTGLLLIFFSIYNEFGRSEEKTADKTGAKGDAMAKQPQILSNIAGSRVMGDRPLCVHVKEVYPGALSDFRWVPKQCSLPFYSHQMVKECVNEGMTHLTVGDAAGEAFYKYIKKSLGLPQDADYPESPVQYVKVPAAWSTDEMEWPEQLSDFLQKVKYVTISLGLNDVVSVRHSSPKDFFKNLRGKVEKVKTAVNPNAVIMLSQIHTIHEGRCETELCKACGEPSRVDVYRSVLKAVASCTGTSILDTTGITAYGKVYTDDGLLYRHDIVRPQTNLILNVMCSGLRLEPPPAECEAETLFKQWENSTASVPCNVAGMNQCSGMDEVYPGFGAGFNWQPERCRLRTFTKDEIHSCFKENPYLAVGDSVGDLPKNYLQELIKKSESGKELNSSEVPVKSIWNPFAAYENGFNSKKGVDYEPYVREEARFVVFSNGMWDIGAGWCGTDAFYDGLVAKIDWYRKALHKDAKVYLLGLQYVHTEECIDIKCKACNPTEKLIVYREILTHVSACTDTPMIDYYPISKSSGKNISLDGVHLSRSHVARTAQLIANVACAGLKPKVFTEIKCDELSLERARQRWRQNQIANTRSEDCPSVKPKCLSIPII